MATPTEIFVPPLAADELIAGLQEEANRQREATPEPNFRHRNIIQSYDYLFEIEHERFTPKEVDTFLMGIREPSYWKCEAQHFKEQLSELIWHNLLRKNGIDNSPDTTGWRSVALVYRRRLKRHGHSTQRVREARLSINDQGYWKPEAECLRTISALREQEMQEKH